MFESDDQLVSGFETCPPLLALYSTATREKSNKQTTAKITTKTKKEINEKDETVRDKEGERDGTR